MATLPAHPNFAQLRHRAKDLLRAARRGDPGAISRIQAVSDRITLAAAQLAVARDYGFASWARLKEAVEARSLDLAQKVDAFCEACVRDRPARAARMLVETPQIAGYSFATAVLLGEADRVHDELQRDPSLAARRDPRTGWTALHAACASRWHHVEPDRAEGLAAVARMLLDAGADPLETSRAPSGRSSGWTPLRCAIASAHTGRSNRAIVELLVANGARPDDHDLYLAGFAHDRHELLRLLLVHVGDSAQLRQTLAAPISNNDTQAVRLLLEAGADPRRYLDDDGKPVPALWAATTAGCGLELIELLVDHGADPNLAGPDGRTPYRLAAVAGRTDLLEQLRGHGAHQDATDTELVLSACMRGDRVDAQRRLDEDPTVLDQLDSDERAALVSAADNGDIEAVTLMLDLGFPLETRGHDGATALHAAAYSGSADTVQLLLDRGADIEARDTTWNSTPLDWAAVGSGERPTNVSKADWPRTVRILLELGASTEELALTPDDPKPPSPEVAALLRARLSQRRG
jgi:ankyrin repeat protein